VRRLRRAGARARRRRPLQRDRARRCAAPAGVGRAPRARRAAAKRRGDGGRRRRSHRVGGRRSGQCGGYGGRPMEQRAALSRVADGSGRVCRGGCRGGVGCAPRDCGARRGGRPSGPDGDAARRLSSRRNLRRRTLRRIKRQRLGGWQCLTRTLHSRSPYARDLLPGPSMLAPWTQAARSLARRPKFAAAAILILGAGIAATTSVFSIVDATVLQPLPYPHPDRLTSVLEANSAKSEAAGLIAPARLEDWNRLNHTFTVLSGEYWENVTETSGDTPEQLAGLRVTPRFFSVFGVSAAVGRTFSPDEEASGGPAAVVISDHLWTRRFHRRADITSQHLELKNQSVTIIGVMPPSFGDKGVDVWLPAQLAPQLVQQRDARFLGGVGRLRPGVSIQQARRDLARVQAALGIQFPATDAGWSAQVTDLKTAQLGDARQPLVFILASVGLLLLIALANTAGLMLTQLQRRETELAIRGFLGASRGQVVTGVVREVLVLAAVAIALAVAADVALLHVSSTALGTL